MLKNIFLQNTRLFKAGTSLELAPLTVLCGTNNSGKSTVLKSILLIRQSQGIKEGNASLPGRLRFTGNQVDLGNYLSFVSDRNFTNDITINFTIQDQISKQAFKTLNDADNFRSIYPTFVNDLYEYELNAGFTFKAFREPLFEDNRRYNKTSFYNDFVGLLNESSFSLSVLGNDILSWSLQLDKYRDKLPSYIFKIAYNYYKVLFDNTYANFNFRRNWDFIEATTYLRGLLPIDLFIEQDRHYNFLESQNRTLRIPLPEIINEACVDFYNAFANIHYLGPLRSPAKRYYLTSIDAKEDYDTSGEFLPNIIRFNYYTIIQNILPLTDSLVDQELYQAIDSWLYYIKTGSQINNRKNKNELDISISKDVLEIAIKGLNNVDSHALIDSGFGYSQILPILVRGLLAPPNSTIIIEQPELHLNPALQVRLADFFVTLIKLGKQVIIETHSEHLVNAVRVIIAENEEKINDKTKIYFFDSSNKELEIKELNILANGAMNEMPIHFFGEAANLTGRLLRAQKHLRDKANLR